MSHLQSSHQNPRQSSPQYQQPRPLKVVAVSGGLNTPSKTESLIDAILAELHHALDIEVHYIKLSEIGTGLGGVISRNDLPANVQHALATIETADALIVGTPVYRASFTGLFKHLFDFVDQFALVDIPVLLAASGGSDRHALVLEHQLRPLFSFFQAQTLPIGVYATDQDFSNYQVSSSLLRERIKLAAARALPIFHYAATQPARLVDAQNTHDNVKLNQPIAQPSVLPSSQVPNIQAAEQALHTDSRHPQTGNPVNSSNHTSSNNTSHSNASNSSEPNHSFKVVNG